ncbi:two-component system, chemotaxis family, sensor kinase CheA [Duganella sp. CF458]|uniref:chemotaxis protein CheA n=1 Tax=Duganella sp. CF458 TaxID=1884368 RepID=UPI0008E8F86D|nr:chemotaxis protein CheA [Duganella sp. CF458]SFH02867.1 two-component system, chemotaxis family, sensor kinase CheA [Duganella sp. CF458]
MDLDDGLQAFVTEAGELLAEMEAGLLQLGEAAARAEAVNAIFRAAHTIKGTAGLFGLDYIVLFTHAVESVLDEVRNGTQPLDDGLVALLLACADQIGAMVRDVERGGRGDLGERCRPQLDALHAYLAPAPGLALMPDALPVFGADARPSGCWLVSLDFGRDVFRQGMDPASFIAYLSRLGRIVALATVDAGLPPPEQMDPQSCYLGFEIVLETVANAEDISKVFEFLHDECTIRLLPPGSGNEDFQRLAEAVPLHGAAIAEVLRASALGTLAAATPPPEGAAPAPALEPAGGATNARQHESRTIRVDAERLGQLITLVGELIIASARTRMIGGRFKDAGLQDSTSALSDLVEQVRDSALQLRMVKIGATFNRFQRVVHDVAREIGKDIRLVLNGEEVELDKTLVERIGDPLTHLVRNAIDHGIEAPELRRRRGKPLQGTVSLNAFHDSGSIVIEVGDDGGGLQRERIVASAIARGLLDPEHKPSDSEVFALIFEPGFSTAGAVTSLSGRGVGMDVVKRSIEALRGSITIDSEAGRGTTVRVRLPLTLAIIDCMLVTVGSSSFAIPLGTIEECVAYAREGQRGFVDLRGEVLPIVALRELFRLQGATPRRESVLVVRHAGQRAGLVVDSLQGQCQAVIKPLNPVFSGISCLSGSTVLGSGDVALILDIPSLLKQLQARQGGNLAA